MKSLKKFFKFLLSDSNEVSHKRLIALLSFLILVGMVGLKAWGKPLDVSLIYTFAALAGGESFLTLLEKKSDNSNGEKGE